MEAEDRAAVCGATGGNGGEAVRLSCNNVVWEGSRDNTTVGVYLPKLVIYTCTSQHCLISQHNKKHGYCHSFALFIAHSTTKDLWSTADCSV